LTSTSNVKVHEKISQVERLRWTFGLSQDGQREFDGALNSFVSAALVAHIPRELVDRYEKLALASRHVMKQKRKK
ncbi:MAG: hypothetical protein ACRDSF_21375, partial [Pseudonocardiaceae bacterium]